jgi:hypothetical protein
MDAKTAKKLNADYMRKITEKHKREYAAIMKREREETAAMWPTRGLMWVEKINGYIEKSARTGRHHTFEPTTTNPNGDEIIYLGEGDAPIYEKLMQYFCDKGFIVTKYAFRGMKITW